MRILIVDDDQGITELAQFFIERAGHTVTVTNNPLQLPPCDSVDVVLCDLMMPMRDGLDVLREFRDVAPHVRRVLWTAAPDTNLDVDGVAHLVITKRGDMNLDTFVDEVVGHG